MKAQTLQLAVINAILDSEGEFSIYDLTKEIREQLARKEIEILDIDDEDTIHVPVGADFVEVPNLTHFNVKTCFENLEEVGTLDKLGFEIVKHGAYRIYNRKEEAAELLSPSKILYPEPQAISGTLTQDFSTCPLKASLPFFDGSGGGNWAEYKTSATSQKINETIKKWLASGQEVTLRRISGTIQEKDLGVGEISDIVKELGYRVEVKYPFSQSSVLA